MSNTVKINLSPCGGLNGSDLIGSNVGMLGLQSVELFGKDYEVWPCWRRYVTGSGGFELPKVHTIPS